MNSIVIRGGCNFGNKIFIEKKTDVVILKHFANSCLFHQIVHLTTLSFPLSSQPFWAKPRLAYHCIEKTPGQWIWKTPQLLPREMWEVICEELQTMFALGVMVESPCEWRSPMCSCLSHMVQHFFALTFARWMSSINLISIPCWGQKNGWSDWRSLGTSPPLNSKGYWQIPLTSKSGEKIVFSTAFGLHQFCTIRFGLHGLALTLQRQKYYWAWIRTIKQMWGPSIIGWKPWFTSKGVRPKISYWKPKLPCKRRS